MKISFQAELSNDYAKALADATTLEALCQLLFQWRRVADDAYQIVCQWTDADFKDWRKALASERRGKFMGEKAAERFAAVLMPEVLFRVQIVATQFHVPWGVAFVRMRDNLMVIEEHGIARIPVQTEG